MTARLLRGLTVGVAIAGLSLGSAAARPLALAADPSPHITPLVWRADDREPQLITVARHRHHLRPEVSADDAPAKKGRRGKAKAAKTVTVGKGDTINAIARRLGTTPAAIMRANPDVSPKRMHTGDALNVPTAEEEASPSDSDQPTVRESSRRGRNGRESARERRAADESDAKPRTYTVKHGDTLYRIGQRFDVPLDDLRRLNGLGHGSSLHTGQVIKLEGRAPAPPPERAARPERPARQRGEPSLSGGVSSSAFAPPAYVPPPAPAPRPAPSSAATAPAAPIPYNQLPGHVAPPAYTPPAPPATYAPPAASPAPASPLSSSPLPPAYTPPSSTPLPPAYAPPSSRPPAPAYTPPPAYTSPPAYIPPPAYTPPPASPSPSVVPGAPGAADAQVAAAGRGRFIWPTRGNVISGFGPKPGGQQNDGVDIAAPAGASVNAAATGDVVYAGNLVPGFGNLVLVKHQDGWVTAYAHLATTTVKIKDHVTQGMTIGTVGVSGGVDQPQLHFEVRYATSPRERARPIDPALVLPVGQ